MKTKILVTVLVPKIESEFEIYIPNNKKIGTIKKKIIESIVDLTDNAYSETFESVKLVDRENCIEYSNNECIKDTGIKNGSKIILI